MGGGGGLRECGNDTSRSTGHSGRQKAATRRNMRRDERVTVQGPVKEQQPDGMSHRGGGGAEGNFRQWPVCVPKPAIVGLSPVNRILSSILVSAGPAQRLHNALMCSPGGHPLGQPPRTLPQGQQGGWRMRGGSGRMRGGSGRRRGGCGENAGRIGEDAGRIAEDAGGIGEDAGRMRGGPGRMRGGSGRMRGGPGRMRGGSLAPPQLGAPGPLHPKPPCAASTHQFTVPSVDVEAPCESGKFFHFSLSNRTERHKEPRPREAAEARW